MNQTDFERILRDAEQIIQDASNQNSEPEKKEPGEKAVVYFMGGAYAGEVFVAKEFATDEHGIEQLHLEYLHDRNAKGDPGDLFNYIRAEGFGVVDPQPSENEHEPDLGGIPTHRVFYIKDGSLFVSTKQGLIPPKKQGGIAVELPHQVTSDENLAKELLKRIAEMPVNSRGRDLFALFAAVLKDNPDKIKLQFINQKNLSLDFDEEDLHEELMQYDEEERERVKKWFLYFKGKVPARWKRWHQITDDLESKSGKDLAQNWIDAAVTHDHHQVVSAACKFCALNVEQMAIALANIGLDGWMAEEIIEFFRNRGVSEESIQDAITLAENKGTSLIDSKLGNT